MLKDKFKKNWEVEAEVVIKSNGLTHLSWLIDRVFYIDATKVGI